MTLLCVTKTQDGRIVAVADTQEVDSHWLVSTLKDGKLLPLAGYDTLLWGYAGSTHVGTRMQRGVNEKAPRAWTEIVSTVQDEIWRVNKPFLEANQQQHAMVAALIAGFIGSTPHMAQIDETGSVVRQDDDTLFVGLVAPEARAIWEAFKLVGLLDDSPRRFELLFRAIAASGSQAIGFPIDIYEMSAGAKPRRTRIE
jgi:hypothetical protein